MSLDFPPELSWVSYLVGAQWPPGDEDKMFALHDPYAHGASVMRQVVIPDTETAVSAIKKAYASGPGREDLVKTLESLTDESSDQSLQAVADSLDKLADSCNDTGCAIYGMKVNIIVGLSTLALDLMLAPLFGPFAPAWISQCIEATELTLGVAGRIFVEVVISGGVGMALMGVTDAIIQDKEIHDGHKKEFDKKEFFQALAGGGVGGAAGALGAKAAGRAFNTSLGDVTTSLGRAATSVGDLAGKIGNKVPSDTGKAIGDAGKAISEDGESIAATTEYGESIAATTADKDQEVARNVFNTSLGDAAAETLGERGAAIAQQATEGVAAGIAGMLGGALAVAPFTGEFDFSPTMFGAGVAGAITGGSRTGWAGQRFGKGAGSSGVDNKALAQKAEGASNLGAGGGNSRSGDGPGSGNGNSVHAGNGSTGNGRGLNTGNGAGPHNGTNGTRNTDTNGTGNGTGTNGTSGTGSAARNNPAVDTHTDTNGNSDAAVNNVPASRGGAATGTRPGDMTGRGSSDDAFQQRPDVPSGPARAGSEAGPIDVAPDSRATSPAPKPELPEQRPTTGSRSDSPQDLVGGSTPLGAAPPRA
ncbi:MAG: hypothetical protein J2P17_24905, partial [Mycobacterium sp.]|nr:hypothetical protein [Mycobacterium sp.]